MRSDNFSDPTRRRNTRAGRAVIACTQPQNVSEGTITSSPVLTPMASRARCKAAVPELTATTWLAPRYNFSRPSNSITNWPCPSQPVPKTSLIRCNSSSPSEGRETREIPVGFEVAFIKNPPLTQKPCCSGDSSSIDSPLRCTRNRI